MSTDDLGRREVMRLAMEHRAQIWGYLMGLSKDPLRAEDLFQNTYLVICEKWAQYEPQTNFIAWALKIARFEFLASVDPARREFVTVEAEVLETALGLDDPRPDALAAKKEALRHCIEELQPKSRQVFMLRYGEGLSCGRVAESAGMTLGALYTLLSRVRQALFDCIERRVRVEEA
ncbi:MAG TPA: sigma-70 family RNA polymerase sigma factor [Planctomycetota bacterium]|nr:sigma-70 family RNA polymerase sigma factor [Planctomycetota bacterium]